MPIDYRRYPGDWKTRIVPAILKRSGGRCEQCGLTDGQTVYSVRVKALRKGKTVYRRLWLTIDPKLESNFVKLVKVVLTVAHLDHDEANRHVQLDRLKHWCQRCHLSYDLHMKNRRRVCGPNCQFPACEKVDFCLNWVR